MKTRSFLAGCALLAAVGCGTTHEYSRTSTAPGTAKTTAAKQDAKAQAPMTEAEMMAAWDKARTLGPQHEAFAKDVGTWDLTLTAWMDPSAPPETYTSTAVRELALGGRYLIEKVKGDMGEFGPFEGMGILGFNNLTQQYSHVWMDSMSTGWMQSTGTASADGTVTMTGSYDDAMTGGKTKARTVTKHISADEQHFAMYEDRGQGETKTMEIVYKRRK